MTAPDARWVESSAAFAEVPAAPGSREQPMERVPVGSIVWTPSGYRAAGGDGLRLAVWESDDAVTWTVLSTLSRACCDRYENGGQLMRWGDRLLLSTSGELRQDGATVPASFLRVSDDDGETWRELGGGPFATAGMSVDDLRVEKDALLVTARVEDASSNVSNSLWRSSDAATWVELDLPGAPPGFRSIAATPSGVLLARSFADDGTQTWYRSTDEGTSFERVDRPGISTVSWPVALVGKKLLFGVHSVADDRPYPPDDAQSGPILVATSDGETWTPIERNTGLWGDGSAAPAPAVNANDAIWFVLERTLREDDAYCFDDVETCEQHQTVLAHISDDLTIQTVAMDLPPTQHFLVAGDDGSLLLWREVQDEEYQGGQTPIEVLRWSAPHPPPLDPEPKPLAPPTDTSEVLGFDVSSVRVGDTFRSRLAVGGCGSGTLEAGDQEFHLQDELRQPIPPSWPFKSEFGDDGPAGYLFVRGSHPDTRTFRFKIDDTTNLTYLHDPTPDDYPICG